MYSPARQPGLRLTARQLQGHWIRRFFTEHVRTGPGEAPAGEGAAVVETVQETWDLAMELEQNELASANNCAT